MPDAPPNTRDRIKAVAAELYVLRGHDGFSFGDVAEAIGTTRANIHHHFGNKRQLMEALIADFATNARARIARHWVEGEKTFAERLAAQRDDLKAFYRRFNKRREDRNVWSPLSRLRHDLPVLGAPAATALEDVNRTYEICLRQALTRAVETGELKPDTPVDDLVRVLRITLLACPPMTQDTGSFDEVSELLDALGRSIVAAWGRGP